MTMPTDFPPLPGPRFPENERQACILAMAEDLAVIADANAGAHDHEGTFPFDTLAAVRKTPFLALTIPEELGGLGASPLETMMAIEALARGDGAVGLIVTMHLGHVAGVAVNEAWPSELKAAFLREVVEHGGLYNTAASEPEMGSPSRGGQYKTRAVRVDGGWQLNGRKSWSTGAPGLTWAGVAASVENEGGELERASFLVPMDTPGVEIIDTWDNMSMAASGSHDLQLTDVVVPANHRLPAAGKPEGTPWSILTCALYIGIAGAARNWAIDFAKRRKPTALGGKAIAELESVQARIAAMEILLLEARSALYSTVRMWEERDDLRDRLGAQMAAVKVIITNNAIEVTDQAMRIVGSVGLQRKHPLERYFRDVRAGLGNPPLNDVAMGIVAKAILAE